MNNPARPHLHDHEDLQHPKARRHGDEEIAGQNALGVVADQRDPTLRRAAASGSCAIGYVASDGLRGDPNSQFQQHLSSDAFFAPGQILARHLDDQFLELGR